MVNGMVNGMVNEMVKVPRIEPMRASVRASSERLGSIFAFLEVSNPNNPNTQPNP